MVASGTAGLWWRQCLGPKATSQSPSQRRSGLRLLLGCGRGSWGHERWPLAPSGQEQTLRPGLCWVTRALRTGVLVCAEPGCGARTPPTGRRQGLLLPDLLPVSPRAHGELRGRQPLPGAAGKVREWFCSGTWWGKVGGRALSSGAVRAGDAVSVVSVAAVLGSRPWRPGQDEGEGEVPGLSSAQVHLEHQPFHGTEPGTPT